MSKWGCGNASRADAVRTRKFREWQDRAEERLEEKRERELMREKERHYADEEKTPRR